MQLRVKQRDLGGDGLEAYYTEHPRPATLAVDPDLLPFQREAREVEARGYGKRRPRDGRKFCFAPRWEHDFDPAAVEAIRSVIDDLRPSWVSEVKEAARLSNRPRWIADWCELSEQVVVAILMNLKARGELPEG